MNANRLWAVPSIASCSNPAALIAVATGPNAEQILANIKGLCPGAGAYCAAVRFRL